MRREDLEAGKTYATDQGYKIKVVDSEPGYIVTEGEYVKDLVLKTRFVKGKGKIEHATNNQVRAVTADGQPIVIEPRSISMLWVDFEAQRKVAVAARKDSASNAKALTIRAKSAGLGPIATDPERERVTLSFGDFDNLLRAVKA